MKVLSQLLCGSIVLYQTTLQVEAQQIPSTIEETFHDQMIELNDTPTKVKVAPVDDYND